MRLWITWLLALLLVASFLMSRAAAKDEAEVKAPTEAAVRTATLTLLRAALGADEDAHVDLMERYFDIDALGMQVFGDDLPASGTAQATELHSQLRLYLARALATLLIGVRAPPSLEDIGTHQIEGGKRETSLGAPSSTPVFLWKQGQRIPILSEFGFTRLNPAAAPLRERWRSSDSSPVAFARELARAAEAKRERFLRRMQINQSKDNMGKILARLIGRSFDVGFPPYSGKNFVLSPLAWQWFDPRARERYEIWFSPGDIHRSLTDEVLERFGHLSENWLEAGADFDELTSYAGRRNAEQAFLIRRGQTKQVTPLLADLSFPRIALVGFSNGVVRELDREGLGLQPHDPIIVGDASKSPLLRMLSDK